MDTFSSINNNFVKYFGKQNEECLKSETLSTNMK